MCFHWRPSIWSLIKIPVILLTALKKNDGYNKQTCPTDWTKTSRETQELWLLNNKVSQNLPQYPSLESNTQPSRTHNLFSGRVHDESVTSDFVGFTWTELARHLKSNRFSFKQGGSVLLLEGWNDSQCSTHQYWTKSSTERRDT